MAKQDEKTKVLGILGNRRIVDDASKEQLKVRVTNVGYTNNEGEPFVRYANTEVEEEVALVSVNAMSSMNAKRAFDHFKAGEYEESLAIPSLSIQVPVAQAKMWEAIAQAKGYCNFMVREYITDAGQHAFNGDSITRIQGTATGGVNPFAVFSTKKTAKQPVIENAG